MKVNVYIRDNYKNKDGECSVMLRIFISNNYFYVPLNIYVNPDNFDKDLQKVTKGPHKINQNHIIKDAMGRASGIILKYQVTNKVLTREVFEKEFLNPARMVDFYAFMEDKIKSRRGSPDLVEASANQHLTALNKLKEFRKECLLSELDENFLRDFQKHLIKKLGNGSNTVYNTLKNVRTYVNFAIKEELITVSPFRYFKLKKVDTLPEFLTEFELLSLFELYGSNYLPTTYQRVLRAYLFSCCTGLRISDVSLVKHEMISNNILSFKPKKTLNTTNKVVHVPLTKAALKLIKDESPQRVKGFLFDTLSDQKMNLYLKDVIKEAKPKIERSLSFHSARHTFATMFLRKIKQANGILILQKLLGHAKLESTMIYTHVLNDDITKAMAEFDA